MSVLRLLSPFAAPRRLLYVTAAGVDCWRVGAGGLVFETAFPADEFAVARFYDWTESPRNAATMEYVVLADLIEEDFRAESIPPVRGRDRTNLLERRLTQSYRETPYLHADSLGIESDETAKRRDERLTLSALTNPAPIDFWVRLLLANQHRVVGVANPGLLADDVLRKLGTPSEKGSGPQLLVTWNSAGLRQTLVLDGAVRFSRLNAFSELADRTVTVSDLQGGLAQGIADEVVRTHQYALGQRVIARDAASLPVVMVLPQALRETVAKRCADSARLQYVFLDTPDLFQNVPRLGNPHGVGGLETLYLERLRRGRRRGAMPGYAPPGITGFFDNARLAKRIIVGGAVAGAAGVGFAAWFGWQAWDAGQQEEQARQQAARATAQYRSIAATFPPTPVPLERMKTSVAAVEKYAQVKAQPEGLVTDVSRALANAPGYELQRIEWFASASPNVGLRRGELADASRAPPEPDTAQGAENAVALPRFEVVVLTGWLAGPAQPAGPTATPVTWSERELLQRAQDVVKALRKVPRASSVEALRMPLDLSPNSKVQTEPSGDPRAGSRLIIRVVRPARALEAGPATPAQPASPGPRATP
jgi:hypothetical protein